LLSFEVLEHEVADGFLDGVVILVFGGLALLWQIFEPILNCITCICISPIVQRTTACHKRVGVVA
jgi:hypothetical protein